MLRGNNRIVVAMSGGVDSSVAAAILKRAGYEVIGLTFKMWPKEECGSSFGRTCCSLESITRARAVAEELKIPYYVIDLSSEFKTAVIDYFCAEYLKGFTPNPCVVCNEKVKFGLLMDKARALGAEKIATGHYARISNNRLSDRFRLKQGLDRSKDQSYFLFSLKQEQLARALFPLGTLTKERVRNIAKRLKLKSENAVSSQDICFIQGMDYAQYIGKKTGVATKEGDIVDISGTVIGRHKGIQFYTIGQRRGLGVAHMEPLYVVAIEPAANRIVAGTKKDVMKRGVIAGRLNWISVERIDKPLNVMAKIRYNHKKARAVILPVENGLLKVEFEQPQEAPTPGQAVVFYDKDTVLGGGWIKEVI